MRVRTALCSAASALSALALLTACGGSGSTTASSGRQAGGRRRLPAVRHRLLELLHQVHPASSPRNSGLELKTTNSQNDVAKLTSNAQTFISQGVKGVAMAPQDTAAIAPDAGAAGGQEDPGRHRRHPARQRQRVHGGARRQPRLRREGVPVPRREARRQGQGRDAPGRPRLDQRPRPHRGVQRVHEEELPRHHGVRRGHQLGRRGRGAEAADRPHRQPGHQGRLHAVQLRARPARCRCSSRRACWSPPTDPKHVFVVSNDGIPEELKDIAEGNIDATVSQPADLYAKYALYYVKAAIDGKTFQPGPTDHDSTIIQVRDGLLEDQLSAPLVTADGGTYGGVPSLKIDDKSLWGNTAQLTGRRQRHGRSAARRRGDGHHQAVRVHGGAGRRPASASSPGETHALVGRNGAGKSTLVVRPHRAAGAGRRARSRFGGEPAPPLADRDAWRQRVACVYQKSTIIPELTVAENLFLNRHDRGRSRLISWRALRARGRAAARRLVGRRRRAQPGRRSRRRAAAVRGDRPGAVVRRPVHHPRRADRPARRRRRSTGCSTGSATCSSQGVTFLFISHHLQEIYEICDMVTVFRDARHILTAPVAELPPGELVAAMTGEAAAVTGRRPAERPRPTAPVAAVDVQALTWTARSTRRRRWRSAPARSSASPAAAAAARPRSPRRSSGCAGRRERARSRSPAGGCRPGSVPDALAAGVGLRPAGPAPPGLRAAACRSRRTSR